MLKNFLYKKSNEFTRLYPPIKEYPEVYNKEGRKLDFFYLQDKIMAPYSESRYFMWDRYNWGLDIHFYTHNCMLITQGKPREKYGMLVESKKIVPDNYKIFDKNKGLASEFTAIFTYDEELLNKLPNAKIFPACANVWYGKKQGEFFWDDLCYQKKKKGISIIASDKQMCELHKKRIEIARYCRNTGLADVYGTIDGGSYCLVDDSLTDYRYSIVMENDVTDYFFTEKITNCFAAQTIPIYMGARKISDFFDKDGIIQVSEEELNNIDLIFEKCTNDYYENHRQAVLNNYNLVKPYRNVNDWLYEKYFL